MHTDNTVFEVNQVKQHKIVSAGIYIYHIYIIIYIYQMSKCAKLLETSMGVIYE